jgi:hypothetical protein
MATAPVLLMANPWGRFEWVELTASIGPCMLGIDRRIRPLAAGLVGLLAILLLASIDAAGWSAPRIAVAAAVLLIGLALAARALEAPEHASAPEVGNDEGDRAARSFPLLEREFGRARRHGRGLALLSITAKPTRSAGTAARTKPDAVASASRTADALETVRALLARELRLYSDVVVDAGRVLALVPEVESDAYDAFVARVLHVLEQGTELEIEIGAASFPKDAVCVEALIEAADRDRATSRPQAQAAARQSVLQEESA